MVAASTHGAEAALQGAVEGRARITASSQGCFIFNLDAHADGFDSQDYVTPRRICLYETTLSAWSAIGKARRNISMV